MKLKDKIIIDTETTGFLEPRAIELDKQPYIIEIYAARLSPKNKIIDEIETFLSVPVQLQSIITKVTGIEEKDLIGQPTFASIYPQLVELFIGTRELIGHNIQFDAGMLWAELSRLDREFKFPWPPNWYCTMENSMYLENKALKLGILHKYATGKEHKEGAHRAKADVMATLRCYEWLKEQENEKED